MKFDAKIDKWINIMLYGSVLILVPMFFFVPQDELFIMFITTMLMALLIIPIARMSYYVLKDDYLQIRMGYIGMKIKYDNIKSIESVDGWNSSSSMALSKERVKITVHNKGKIMGTTYICPENRELFIMDLRSKCKNLDGSIDF